LLSLPSLIQATKLFHTTPDSTEEELFFDNDRYAEIILHVLVFFLPVFFFASMVVLSAIQKLIYRLAAIMVFTLVFAGIVVRFSRAGPFELFASTVA
jgi:DNA integrity scanning protein DisA with diadenylate cyclase activity